jgi:hypothetical protein
VFALHAHFSTAEWTCWYRVCVAATLLARIVECYLLIPPLHHQKLRVCRDPALVLSLP